MAADQIGATLGPAAGSDVAERHRTTVARAENLARHLTALAERYDVAVSTDEARAAERRTSVALMRGAAEAARELVRSMAAPVPVGVQAAAPNVTLPRRHTLRRLASAVVALAAIR